jgi:gliding motility-associated-like protein
MKILYSVLFLFFSLACFSQPANDACTTATSLGSLPTPAACPSGVGAVTSIAGTLNGATPGNPYVFQNSCTGSSTTMASPALDVWYSFTATGYTGVFNITGSVVNPNIALYSGTCAALGGGVGGCAVGNGGGSVTLTVNQLVIGQTYFLQVSGNSTGGAGNFTLKASNSISCTDCMTSSTLTANTLPVNGTYQPGQTVTFCYHIDNYAEVNTNWLHGVQVALGSGWNLASLVASPVTAYSCGTWNYYPAGITNTAGTAWPAGFYFDRTCAPLGGGTAGDGNPGNNYGDHVTANTLGDQNVYSIPAATWNFCFSVQVASVCTPGSDLSVTMNTSGDGESGVWSSLGCVSDPATISHAMGACCPPAMASTPASCFGVSDGTATATPVGTQSPFTYSWSPGGQTTQTATGLPAGTYTVYVTDKNNCVSSNTVTVGQPTALSATNSLVNNACNGGATGSASVVASGATPAYTYAWSPSGGTTATASGLTGGAYTCTITDSKGCSITSVVTLTDPPALTATNSQTNVACNGGATGSATVVPAGGTGAYTYAWTPSGGTAATASGLVAGTYTCTIKDNKGCTITSVITITQPAALAATTTQTNETCNGGSTGTATVTPTGGTLAYTYAWTPSGGTGATANGLAAGAYTCTITDSKSCSITSVVNITQPALLSATNTHVNELCHGGSTGSATVTPTGGTGAYTYAWAPSGGTAAMASGLVAGGYVCTITDNNGCTATSGLTITEPSVITLGATSVAATCGNSDGSASVTAGGGTGAYTYSWTPVGGTGTTATGLSAGTYTITVHDANNCLSSTTIAVSNSGGATASISASTNVTCHGGSNGSATVTSGGGTAPYTYSWSPTGGTAATASGLIAGTYNVSVKDASGCQAIATVTITEPSAVTATATHSNESCNGGSNGTASVNASGGTGAYTYSWSPSGGASSLASGLSAGSYSCLITDTNGCPYTANVTITQPTAVAATSSTTNETCFGGTSGSATVVPAGGTGGYTYSWSPSGGNSATASGLTAGNYTCTINDANNCSGTVSVVITQPAQLVLTPSSVPASCGKPNGSASVTVAGGTGAYTYSWTPTGGTASTASGLSAGTYTVTVQDASGCSANTTIPVTNSGGPTASPGVVTPITCFGSCNGTASVTVTGGSAPLTYSWNSGAAATPTVNGLCPGSHTCTVTDANGCITSTSMTITQPGPIVVNIPSSTPVSCNGGANGSAIATASGGSGALTYSWTPSGGNSAFASGLIAGLYTITVKDANGCSAIDTVTIKQPTKLTLSTAGLAASCFGSCNGTLICIPAGGSAPYVFSWSSGCSAASCPNTCAGLYTIVVTDSHGCSAKDTTSVQQPPPMKLTLFATAAHCNHADGKDSVSVSGGKPGYTYSWSPGAGSNTSVYTNLVPGNYVVTVHDAGNCAAKDSLTVPNTPGETASIVGTVNTTCFGGNDGSAQATGIGGTAPYAYSWSPGTSTADTAKNIAAGTYVVTVTDAHGCLAQATAIVSQPTQVVVTPMPAITLCIGQCSALTATGSGGTPGYTYTWTSAGAPVTSPACPIVTTTYTVTSSDSKGCLSLPGTVLITVNPPLVLVKGKDTSLCPGATAQLTASATGGDGIYHYSWSPSTGLSSTTVPNPTATPTATTTYNIVVTDNCGTPPANASVVVTIYPVPSVVFSATDTAGCVPLCVSFSALANPACANANWSFGDGYSATGCGTQNHCYTSAGVFTPGIQIVDLHGCKASLSIPNYIDVHPVPEAAFVLAPQPTTIVNSEIIFTDHSTAAVNWSWSFGDLSGASSVVQNPRYTYPDTGCFTSVLVVQNTFGCRDSAKHPVCIRPEFTFFAPNAFTPNGDGTNDFWFPQGLGIDPATYHLMMFDRWGNLMWETHTWGQGWDGRANGGDKIAQEDTYVWKCDLRDYLENQHKYTGICNLIK